MINTGVPHADLADLATLATTATTATTATSAASANTANTANTATTAQDTQSVSSGLAVGRVAAAIPVAENGNEQTVAHGLSWTPSGFEIFVRGHDTAPTTVSFALGAIDGTNLKFTPSIFGAGSNVFVGWIAWR